MICVNTGNNSCSSQLITAAGRQNVQRVLEIVWCSIHKLTGKLHLPLNRDQHLWLWHGLFRSTTE